MYLFYQRPGNRLETHLREIEFFAERVGDEIGFKALTYQEVFKRLKDSGQANLGYLDYLANRYFSRMALR